jgi:hypothetical protein
MAHNNNMYSQGYAPPPIPMDMPFTNQAGLQPLTSWLSSLGMDGLAGGLIPYLGILAPFASLLSDSYVFSSLKIFIFGTVFAAVRKLFQWITGRFTIGTLAYCLFHRCVI